MTTYSALQGDRIYGGRAVPVRNPALASVTWPPGANCTIPDAEGVNVPTHPKVLDFGATLWNGYRYWMAFTPYPLNGDDKLENPCVVASNDGDVWVAPAPNPIVPRPIGAQTGRNYNSDTHLAIKDGVLYLIYRHVTHTSSYSGTTVETLYYLTSVDGVAWSAPTQFMQTTTTDPARLLSPCVHWHAGEWWMWAYRREGSQAIYCVLFKSLAIDGPWSAAETCTLTISAAPAQLWHFDVVRVPNGWAQLIGDRYGDHRNHWVSYSQDGVTWETPKNLTLSAMPNIYRSTLVRAGSGFDCWIGDWDARAIRRTRIEDAQL